ncbi:MAG: TolC family protein [Bacteroidales bacterium]|nr:TolC family protein [Bacteroidales bacterium]
MKRLLLSIAFATLFLTAGAQQRWTLSECINYAVEHNVNIRQQQNTIEQSEINLNTAKMNRLPSVDAQVNQSWNFGRGLSADNTYVNRTTSSTSFNVGANMILFNGFQNVRNIELSKLQLDAATADLGRAKEDLGIQVTSAYLEVLYADEILQVAENQKSLSEFQLTMRQKLLENGKASESDVVQAKSQVAQDQLSIVQAENNYRLALLELSQLLELPSPDSLLIEKPDTNDVLQAIASIEDVYADALNNKSVIKADELRIQSAEKEISIAKAGYYPTLSLSGGVGSNYYTVNGFDNDNFSKQMSNNFSQYIALSLNVPIFNKFATRNRVRSSKLQYDSQNLQLESDKKILYKEVQQAYYSAVASESKYSASISAEESAAAAFELMSKKYENGKASQTEYNESRTQWMKAVADRIQAKYEYMFKSKILDYYRGV